jgi:glycosyltransferase involved in cell wall biosynthesis
VNNGGRSASWSPPLVVYLDHVGRLSGAEISLVRLIDALVRQELVRAHVILSEDGELIDRLRQSGATVEVVPLPERTRNIPRESTGSVSMPFMAAADSATHVVNLALRLKQLTPDLVHTNSMKAHLLGGMAARLANVPQIWHAHDRLASDYLPGRAVRALRAAIRVLPAYAVANSQETLSTLKVPRKRARVIPSPLPSGWPEEAPRAHPGRTGPAVVGVVGRLSPWKGQDVFLRAFAAAHRDPADRALIVGSALFGEKQYASGLRDLCDTLDIGGRVTFTEHVNDVSSLLAGLTTLVHCSRVPEPFGQVVIEGMAAGLPVVATDVGGPSECLRHEITGLLTPMEDVGELIRALSRLNDDRVLRERLGSAARIAAGTYRATEIAPQFAAVYADVLSEIRRQRGDLARGGSAASG